MASGSEWRVTVGDGSTRPVEDVVPGDVVSQLHQTLARAAPAVPRMLLAGADAGFTRAEDTVGAALATALASAPRAWAHLQVLRGRAEAAGVPPTVVVDADPALDALPWELVSFGDGPLESVGGGLVVRLATGTPAVAPPSPTFAVWTGGDDLVTTDLAARVRATLRGLTEVPLDCQPTLLWVIAHGERGADRVAVALGADGAGAGAVAARLEDAVRSARAAFLGVCHGGATDVARLEGLVGRLLAGGVGVLVAPRTTVPADVIVRFATGAAAAFERGETLGRAIGAGRRAVRAWGMPHPLARWTSLGCWVSTPEALDGVPRPAGWVPPGWPSPAAEVAPWLDAAHRDAIRRGDGYVGMEHLVRALVTIDGGGPLAEAVRRVSGAWLRTYEDVAAALTPQRTPEAPVRPSLGVTPRIARWGGSLAAGFGIEALADRLATITLPQRGPGPEVPDLETMRTEARPPADPPTALEVVGGPEDGRLLQPAVGDTIGRAGGDAVHVLYDGTRLTDRSLSRLHLRWVGPGRVAVARGTDEHALAMGDILALSAGTRVRGVGGTDGRS